MLSYRSVMLQQGTEKCGLLLLLCSFVGRLFPRSLLGGLFVAWVIPLYDRPWLN